MPPDEGGEEGVGGWGGGEEKRAGCQAGREAEATALRKPWPPAGQAQAPSPGAAQGVERRASAPADHLSQAPAIGAAGILTRR